MSTWIPPNGKRAYAVFDGELQKCIIIEGFENYVWVKFEDYSEPETWNINDISFNPCLDGVA